MNRDIIVKRLIDAPVELVWKAWTEPEHVMRWWGPDDYTSPSATVDLKEGGTFVFAMRAPKEQGGADSYTAGVYRKIVPQKRLEFVQSLSDKDGNPIDPMEIGMPADFPKEVQVVVEFKTVHGDMTELIITERGWTVSQMFVYSLAGLHQTVDKLIASLS